MKNLIILPILLFTVSCSTQMKADNDAKQASYDSYNVKKFIKKGVTTQAEILKEFGGPSVSTINSDNSETWSYSSSKTSIDSESNGFGGLLGIIPGPAGVLAGAFSESDSTGISSNSKSLIITFKNSTVTDYQLVQTM